MPSRERVEQFVQVVEAGEYLRAIDDFYHPNASMQENGAPPREGRDNLVAHERKFLASLASMRTRRVETVLVDGERVVINWVFEMTDGGGKTAHSTSLPCSSGKATASFGNDFITTPASCAPPTESGARLSGAEGLWRNACNHI